MSELSRPYAELARLCPSCGGMLPCPLHDAKLREAILAPPERDDLPWERLERREIADIGKNISSLFALPHGLFLVASQSGYVYMCDPSTEAGERVREIAYYYTRPDFFPLNDGRFLMSLSGSLYIFDPLLHPEGGVQLRDSFQGDQKIVTALAPTNDGRYIAGVADGDIFFFDPLQRMQRIEEGLTNFARADSASRITAMVPTGNGKFLVGNSDGVLAMLDLAQEERHKRIRDIAYSESGFKAFHPMDNGSFLIVHENGDLALFDETQPEHERMRALENCGVSVLAVAPFGEDTLLVGGQDGRLRLVEPTKPPGERVRVIADYREAGDLEAWELKLAKIASIIPTSDHSFVVGGFGGKIIEYAIPESDMTAWRSRKLNTPEVPPMPE